MTLFHLALIGATFLCSLVAGFLFAFAAVVMPGIGTLNDRDFIRAFQVIDGVIQRGQRPFMVVWVGSTLLLVTVAVVAVWQLGGADRLLAIATAFAYVLGVQVPSVRINIPLNNQLQRIDSGSVSDAARRHARSDFERRWNRSNLLRTVCANLVAVLLMILLVRIGLPQQI